MLSLDPFVVFRQLVVTGDLKDASEAVELVPRTNGTDVGRLNIIFVYCSFVIVL